MFNMVCITLGNYLPVEKYLDGIEVPHEGYYTQTGQDLFNVSYTHLNKLEVELVDPDEELKSVYLDCAELAQFFTPFSVLNPPRTQTEEDVIGLYGNDTYVNIKYPYEDIEDVLLTFMYNYWYKSQTLPEKIGLLYIIDNAPDGANSQAQIETLIEKYQCTTTIVTRKNPTDFAGIHEMFPTLELEIKSLAIDI